jgi:hypothetical protein
MGSSLLEGTAATTSEDVVSHGEKDELERKMQPLAETIRENESKSSDDNPRIDLNDATAITVHDVAEEQKLEKRTTISKEDLLHRAVITQKGKETEANKLFVNLSRRFPSAACVKDLDFQTFKAKTVLGHGGNGGSLGGGIKIEPIFTKITNEIKFVQNTQHQYEQYIAALRACYEALFWDVAKELDTVQGNVDRILSRLDQFEKEATNPNPISNHFSTIPFVERAFQSSFIHAMPEHSTVLRAGTLAIVLLLLRYFVRSKKMRGPVKNDVRDNRNLDNGPPKDLRHIKSTATEILELVSDSDLLKKELDYAKIKLAEKDEKLKCLQLQHALLQQRYSQLEQTISTLEIKIHQMTPAKDIMRVSRNGYSTPLLTDQSEPERSRTTTVAPTDEPILREHDHTDKT